MDYEKLNKSLIISILNYKSLRRPSNKFYNEILSKILKNNIEINHLNNGKPILNTNLEVSISHTSGVLFILISNDLLGIDVQKKNKYDLTSMIVEPNTKNNNIKQLIYVSLKESLGKCIGIGLSGSVYLYEIIDYRIFENNIMLCNFKYFPNLFGIVLESENYIYTIVLSKRIDKEIIIRKIRGKII